jgi:adenylosuccinate synthase
MRKGKFNVVLGGQAGSESKGKLSGVFCETEGVDMVVMTASPNAGHTIIKPDGTKLVSYHLPIGAVMCEAPIVLTAASLINMDIFIHEVKALGINPRRILVDPRASIIHPGHIHDETSGKMSDIGSTLQGIGECRIGKMQRKGRGEHTYAADTEDVFRAIGVTVLPYPASVVINNHLDMKGTVLAEGTQGFDLDLEHGIDRRYCTSKMINPAMIMAEAGVAPSRIGHVYGVIRPYPIRVNNRTGTSGPYAEAQEIDWQTVAQRCGFPGDVSTFGEITTTTKLPRRVFEFCWSRYDHFVRVCRPDIICLQFANYLDWGVYEMTDEEQLRERSENVNCSVLDFCNELEWHGPPVEFIGTGPKHEHMIRRDKP